MTNQAPHNTKDDNIWSLEKVERLTEQARSGDYEALLEIRGRSDLKTHLIEFFPLYLAGAQKGDLIGQLTVAYCYEMGIGAEIDHAEATKWYTLVIEIVDNKCRFSDDDFDLFKELTDLVWYDYDLFIGLGKAYYKAGHADKAAKLFHHLADTFYDNEAAFIACRSLAEDGIPLAQYYYGMLLFKYNQVHDDYMNYHDLFSEEGMKWLMRAAEEGNAKAQYNIYLISKKFPGEISDPIRWLRKAVANNHKEARMKMVDCLTGVLEHNEYSAEWIVELPENINELKMIIEAAENGHHMAHRLLEKIYADGFMKWLESEIDKKYARIADHEKCLRYTTFKYDASDMILQWKAGNGDG